MSLGRRSAALLHGQGGCHPTGCSPPVLPSGAHFLLQTLQWGRTSQGAPAWGHPISHIPYPASLPAMGQAELRRILLTPTKGKSVVSFQAKSCGYLGYNSRFGEVSGKSQWLPWPLDLAWKPMSGLIGVVPCVKFHRAVGLGGLAPILKCFQDQTPGVHLF